PPTRDWDEVVDGPDMESRTPPIPDPKSPRLSAPMAGLTLGGISPAKKSRPRTTQIAQMAPSQLPHPLLGSLSNAGWPNTTARDSPTQSGQSPSAGRVGHSTVRARTEAGVESDTPHPAARMDVSPGERDAPRTAAETMAVRNEPAIPEDARPLCEGD